MNVFDVDGQESLFTVEECDQLEAITEQATPADFAALRLFK